MSFINPEVDLERLPRFDEVQLRRLDARYPRVVLGVTVAFELAALLVAFVVAFGNPEGRLVFASGAGLTLAIGAVFIAAGLAWFAHKSASVIRYAVREHDVILRSGVFWKQETIQPIRRIQHVEQLQGPVARRFGLYKIKLYSAGTAQSAFEIPGLDAPTAARVRQSILSLRESTVSEPPSQRSDGRRAGDARPALDTAGSPRADDA